MKLSSDEILFDWCDSTTMIMNDKQEVVSAGTCLVIKESIIFLAPLNLNQLNDLKNSVVAAVDHEIKKRAGM